MNIQRLLHCQPWRDVGNGRLKITIKERRQFGNKKSEGLESEFDSFDVYNSYPTLPFQTKAVLLSIYL